MIRFLRVSVVGVVTAALAATACVRLSDEARVPPTAEFLFAAGDSTWWVRSSAEGLRVRSAPILLTYADGHFYEVFVSEENAEYETASFANARVYSRDVMRGDSLVIYDDPTARRAIARWKRDHPQAVPLDLSEELDIDEPATAIIDNIEIIDVHGQWVTVQHAFDMDIEGRSGHRHTRRRALVDVRTGRRGTLATMFGAEASAHAVRDGRLALEALKDSVRRAGDTRADRARETLATFALDVSSFTLTDIDREPAVSFMVPGQDADGSAIAVNLPPVVMPVQPWWADVAPTLPEWAADSGSLQWTRPSYMVRATPIGDGTSLSLVVVDVRDTVGGRVPREWELATVVAPAYQLIALDDHPMSRELRAALARAFDAASTVDGIGQRVNRDVRNAQPPIRTVSRPLLPRRTD